MVDMVCRNKISHRKPNQWSTKVQHYDKVEEDSMIDSINIFHF